MNLRNKWPRCLTLGAVLLVGIFSCQKLSRPALGDYPKDSNPAGGPLKFFAAYEGTSVDSIRANFGADVNVTYADGVNGKAMSVGKNGYIAYSSINDVARDSSLTIAFWMKKAGPNAAGGGTSFAFGFGTSVANDLNQDVFLEFEDAGNPSSADSAAAKFHLLGQWFEFTLNTGAGRDTRLPKVLDGNWHHLAFTYDYGTSTVIVYIDGAALTNLPTDYLKYTNNNGFADFSSFSGLVVGGPGAYATGATPDSWMGDFNGSIDQFRIYGEALSASDIAALFTGKQ